MKKPKPIIIDVAGGFSMSDSAQENFDDGVDETINEKFKELGIKEADINDYLEDFEVDVQVTITLNLFKPIPPIKQPFKFR